MHWQSYTKVGDLFTRATVLNADLAASREIAVSGAQDIRIDIEVFTVTGTNITFTLEYYDDAADAWTTLLAAAAATTAVHKTLEAGLHMTTASNTKLQCVLPKRLRLKPTGSSLTSAEYAASFTAL